MSISRYRNNEILDSKSYSTFNFPTQEQLDDIQTYSVRVNKFDRLDNLAAKYLGDGSYWWVIAIMNNLEWAFKFDEGDILLIPIDVQDVLRLI